ncbi:hypothetical protein DP939_10710 [Spongiactinospora rosea]|uniref:YiaAB two helix domain-containing protein n=1 Tax=Spongiactinospora rosea TaxID=2248750 RepID=A0A366M3D1_9ACTN|nr:YiaA/YiaB family inner membrane protein [Spongiactinospora rosea]RBQ20270.1 hypothetical protein DP939_10710 [Spongiactinospora rosea]
MNRAADKAIIRNPTTAFFVQAVLAFAISLGALIIGVAYLPVDGWIRAFFAVGVLYVVTSAFTLAKIVRDRQEIAEMTSRIDQARLERLIAEHDPFKVD